ncbi:DUF4214 domain-containing protein, partial [bacterium]|nr:DUF4214 domain-containing protein [bacterium]
MALSKFVEGITRDILGRQASPLEIDGWVKQLASGVSRQTVAICLLNSVEKRRAFIREWHIRILREQPSEGQLRFWLDRIEGGATQEEVIAELFTSPQSLALHGSRSEPFVQSLFKALLDRRPTPGEIAAWSGLLEGLVATHRELVLEFLQSPEFREERIQQWYRNFLRRPATQSEVKDADAMLVDGHALEEVLASVLAGAEYLQRKALV